MWKKPTYEGMISRVEHIDGLWKKLLAVEADETKKKLENIKMIAENAKIVEEYRKADKKKFKARIVEE
jgi:hypothetical protein